VLHVKFLGDVGLVDVGVQGFEAPLRARVAEREVLRKGAEVSVAIDPSRVLVFPASNEGIRFGTMT
jgi:iron(III) transport system ATP-binding protein